MLLCDIGAETFSIYPELCVLELCCSGLGNVSLLFAVAAWGGGVWGMTG